MSYITSSPRRERTDVSLVSSNTVSSKGAKSVLALFDVFVPTYFIELKACGICPISENLSFRSSSADLNSWKSPSSKPYNRMFLERVKEMI